MPYLVTIIEEDEEIDSECDRDLPNRCCSKLRRVTHIPSVATPLRPRAIPLRAPSSLRHDITSFLIVPSSILIEHRAALREVAIQEYLDRLKADDVVGVCPHTSAKDEMISLSYSSPIPYTTEFTKMLEQSDYRQALNHKAEGVELWANKTIENWADEVPESSMQVIDALSVGLPINEVDPRSPQRRPFHSIVNTMLPPIPSSLLRQDAAQNYKEVLQHPA